MNSLTVPVGGKAAQHVIWQSGIYEFMIYNEKFGPNRGQRVDGPSFINRGVEVYSTPKFRLTLFSSGAITFEEKNNDVRGHS